MNSSSTGTPACGRVRQRLNVASRLEDYSQEWLCYFCLSVIFLLCAASFDVLFCGGFEIRFPLSLYRLELCSVVCFVWVTKILILELYR